MKRNMVLRWMLVLCVLYVGMGHAASTRKGSIARYAKTGNLAKVKEVLQQNPELINKKKKWAQPPLYYAVKYNQPEVARYLLSRKANPAHKDKAGTSLLHMAVLTKALGSLKVLLEHGVDVQVRDPDGNTPLHWAATHGHAEAATVLLDAKADPVAKNAQGITPLHWAAEKGQADMLACLAIKGAPLDARDPNHWSPLHWAVRGGHVGAAEVLIKHGATVDIKDGVDATPLHWAVVQRRKACAKLLLKSGGDINARNRFGQTPLSLANDDMKALLRTPKSVLGSVKEDDPTVAWKSGLRAFPGAEGFGALTPGGRFGRVVHVTNLNDSGPGSLRAAIETMGPRIIVFDVGGVIELKKKLAVPKGCGNYTLAGQTAPGGISITGKELGLAPRRNSISDFVIRNIRVRTTAGGEADGISMYARNFVIDHVSIAGGCDENVGSYSSQYTFQWSTVEACALWGQVGAHHPEGNHNRGYLQGYNAGARLTLHHNLIADHSYRLPLFSKITKGGADHRNNISYNWGGTATLMNGCTGGHFNMVNNCYVLGPQGGRANAPNRCIAVKKGTANIYPRNLTGNLFWPVMDAPAVTDFGVKNDKSYLFMDKPWPAPPVTTQPASEAFESVLKKSGAWPRDALTRQTIAEVRSGTRTGGHGIRAPYEYFPMRQGPCSAKFDTDRDGMPDVWERKHGLDPKDPRDACRIVPPSKSERHGGYTYIEYYINELMDTKAGKGGTIHVIATSSEPKEAGAVLTEQGVYSWEPDLYGGYNRPYWFGCIEFGTQQYNDGSIVILKAKARPGHVFSHWEGGPVDGLTSTRVSFPAQADARISAHFKPVGSCNLNVTIRPKDAGGVAGGGAYRIGEVATLAAYGKKGYVFKRWVGGPFDGAMCPTLQLEAGRDVGLVAEFEKGDGGDFLIDDFSDKNDRSLFQSKEGNAYRWATNREVRVRTFAPGEYGLTNGSDGATRDVELRGGGAEIPVGTTVLKLRIRNIGKAQASIRGTGLWRMRFWGAGFFTELFYDRPLRFPVVEAGGAGILAIPLAQIRTRTMDQVLNPGRVLTRFHFRGMLAKRMWGSKVAVDHVSFGRSAAKPKKIPNLPPVANAGSDQRTRDLDGDGKECVLLNGVKSFDREGGVISSWKWSHKDKTIANVYAPEVELPVGTNTITLTLTDEAGATSTDAVVIRVDAQ